METKFKIVETEGYTLAVSDEERKVGNYALDLTEDMGLKHDVFKVDKATLKFANQECKKIIGYQPKGNASELDLPLLPDVEDDIEKLAKKYINDTLKDEESDDYFLGRMEGFKDGHKAATKVYSEEDLIDFATFRNGGNVNEEFQLWKSLKQPKWFVAEIEEWLDQTYSEHGCYKQKLKIITINNNTYLVGTYLN
jgi:hypothetical protein